MLISSFWMPTFSDKVGRRPAIILSIAGSFMGFVLSACADYVPTGTPAFSYFIAMRCFSGLFGGTNTVANAFIVDLYDESERAKQFANLAAASVGAFTFGPFIGGGMAQFGLNILFWFAAALSLVAGALAWRFVKEPRALLAAMNNKGKSTRSIAKSLEEAEAEQSFLVKASNSKSKGGGATKKAAVAPSGRSGGSGGGGGADGDDITVEVEGLEMVARDPDAEEEVHIDAQHNDAAEEEQGIGKNGKSPSKDDDTSDHNNHLPPAKEPRVWLMSAQTMLLTIAFNGLTSLQVLLLLEPHLNIVDRTDSVENQGKKTAIWTMVYVPAIGVTIVGSMVFLFPRVSKKIGLLQSAIVGAAILGGGMFALPYWPEPAYIFITEVVVGLGRGLGGPVANAYLARFASKKNAARVLAFGTVADSLGNIIGPFLTQLYRVDRFVPFWVAASAAWITIIIDLTLKLIGMPKYANHVEGEGTSAEQWMTAEQFAALRQDPRVFFTAVPEDEIPLVTRQYSPFVAQLADQLNERLKQSNHAWFYTRCVSDGLHVDFALPE